MSYLGNPARFATRSIERPTFTPGATTVLTLEKEPGSSAAIDVIFDGAVLERSGYTVSSNQVLLTSAVPLGTAVVEVVLNTNTITTAPISISEVAVVVSYAAAGTTSINCTQGTLFHGAASGGATTWSFTNPLATGQVTGFILELTNGGAFTQTWPASVRWDGGIAPTLTASGTDILAFYTKDAGANWRGVLISADSK